MLDSLTLDQLRLFVAVAETGSLTAAGRHLRRTQSAVSYGIANLEQLLDVRLFNRSGRSTALTAEGQTLLADARAVLAGVSRLESRAATWSSDLERSVALAVDTIAPAELLVSICSAFQERFPHVALHVHAAVLQDVAALVLEDKCQVGLSGPIGADSSRLSREFISEVSMIPVASAAHPLATRAAPIPTAEALDAVQILISQREGSDALTPTVVSAVKWRVADAATKLVLIRAGLGWGTLPLSLVQRDLESGNLVRLHLEEWGPDPIRAPLFAISRIDAALGPASHWLLDKIPDFAPG